MEAVRVYGSWIFIRWVNNDVGHLTKTLIKDLRKIEALIREKKWKGWLTNSEKDHTVMHGIIEKLGGVKYDEDEELVFFKKEMNHV